MGWSYGGGGGGSYGGGYDYGYYGSGYDGTVDMTGDSGNGVEAVTVTATSYDGYNFDPGNVYVYGDSDPTPILAAYNGPMASDSLGSLLGDLEQYFLDLNSMSSVGNQGNINGQFMNVPGSKTEISVYSAPDGNEAVHGKSWQDINGDIWSDRNGDGIPDEHFSGSNVDYGDGQGMHPYGTGTVPPPPPAPWNGS